MSRSSKRWLRKVGVVSTCSTEQEVIWGCHLKIPISQRWASRRQITSTLFAGLRFARNKKKRLLSLMGMKRLKTPQTWASARVSTMISNKINIIRYLIRRERGRRTIIRISIVYRRLAGSFYLKYCKSTTLLSGFQTASIQILWRTIPRRSASGREIILLSRLNTTNVEQRPKFQCKNLLCDRSKEICQSRNYKCREIISGRRLQMKYDKSYRREIQLSAPARHGEYLLCWSNLGAPASFYPHLLPTMGLNASIWTRSLGEWGAQARWAKFKILDLTCQAKSQQLRSC